MNATPTSRQLTNAQALLLGLFERNLSETELMDVQQVLVNHFAQKAEEEVERILMERGQTTKDLEEESLAINENRTAFRQRLRTQRL